MVLAGKTVIFNPLAPPEARSINPQWIEEAARNGQTVNIIDGVIRGDLSLRFTVIQKAFQLVDCEADGMVDLSYADFKSILDLQGTRFMGLAIFEGTDAEKTLFLQPVGPGQTPAAVFEAPVNFAYMRVGSILDCEHVTFRTQTIFRSVQIGSDALFRDATFRGTANFEGAAIGGIADFAGAQFHDRASFGQIQARGLAFPGAVFRKQISFNAAEITTAAIFIADSTLPAAQFYGTADFTAFTTAGALEFDGTSFHGQLSLADAKIGGISGFQGTSFVGDATFERAQFNSAIFSADPKRKLPAASFVGAADFTGAHFAGPVSFSQVRFKGATDFSDISIGGIADFDGAYFLHPSELLFVGAKFEQNAFFNDTSFSGDTKFEGAQFELGANFEGAIFHGMGDFALSYFGGSAYFGDGKNQRGPTFAGKAFFDYAEFARDADFEDTVFGGDVVFRNAHITTLILSRTGKVDNDDQLNGTVDMRGCTYASIQGNWQQLLQAKDGNSRVVPYDLQPYSQLEAVLRADGRESDAEAVFLDQKRIERERDWSSGKWFRWLATAFWGWTTLYGYNPGRLAVVAFLLLAFSAFIFSRNGAVCSNPRFSDSPDNGRSHAPTVDSIPLPAAFILAFRYFLPIELPAESPWQPSTDRFRIQRLTLFRFCTFGNFLRVAGWILVPVFIALLTIYIYHAASPPFVNP
jgi:uncharacterized protein YjbI with pentapeptide repeats